MREFSDRGGWSVWRHANSEQRQEHFEYSLFIIDRFENYKRKQHMFSSADIDAAVKEYLAKTKG